MHDLIAVLSLARQTGRDRPWTDREERVLRRGYCKPGHSLLSISAALDHTDHEVASKAHRLGLSCGANVDISKGLARGWPRILRIPPRVGGVVRASGYEALPAPATGTATTLDPLYGVAGNIRSLQKVYRVVERYWLRMLRSRSWAAGRLTWDTFHQIKQRTPLLQPKPRLPYGKLQALAVL